LGSKHHSLQTGEVGDLVDMLSAYEDQNRVRVRWTMELPQRSPHPDILVTVEAYERRQESGVVQPLASANVTCLATGLRDLASVLIHALYLLDSRLAEHEWQVANPKS